MTEFNLVAYFVASSAAVTSAFGSGDASLPASVLAHPNVQAQVANNPNGQKLVTQGLEQIIATPVIERPDYSVAVGVEMLYAANGASPEGMPTAIVLGFTEDCLPALTALNMPTLHRAMDTLAWGREVVLPVPISTWDDVSGQFYFDATTRTAALAELGAAGSLPAAVNRVEGTNPEAFDECDPSDLEWQLTFFESVLTEAEAKNQDVAVFRHGGV